MSIFTVLLDYMAGTFGPCFTAARRPDAVAVAVAVDVDGVVSRLVSRFPDRDRLDIQSVVTSCWDMLPTIDENDRPATAEYLAREILRRGVAAQ
jgi:hypothetical protein